MQTIETHPLPAHLRVRALVLDVDGVMTDGAIGILPEGEAKAFHVADGQAIKFFQRAGHQVALLTGRRSPSVERRASELGIEVVVQDAKTKLPELKAIAERLGVSLDEICYVGDDMPDIPCLRAVGLPVAVADACEPARRAAACVLRRPGGRGAVREVVEWILKSQGRWAALMERYGGE
ncbi:MAG: HAD-IIIA family hydrolase [Candidatus Sumerlaeota bacterium]|nr:HAD-IIIA family hydrolase [Candidatus Sumerlaeota bacterium]